ncbi:MAG: ABC-2 family transporter protein [Deltaproteobacteria bacterium]|nr:ABC-2 family transporter protein [Deltaproteobacteria bacterium]
MIRCMRLVPALVRFSTARVMAYRAEMVIWILSASLPLVMLALWNAVAAEGPIAGMGQGEMARYFAATLLVNQLTGVWIVWQLNYEIRTGLLSTQLLRPVHPLWHNAVWMMTALPIRALVMLPILGALLAWRPDLWVRPDPLMLPVFALSVAMAWALAFLVQATFAILSFWLDQSIGLFGVWYSGWALLSGYVAPLALFPDWAQRPLRFSPFRAMLGLPVELLGGFVSPREVGLDLAVQAGWVLGALVLVRVLWRRGLRHYGAYGA